MNDIKNKNSRIIKVLLGVLGVLVIGVVIVCLLLVNTMKQNPEEDNYAALKPSNTPHIQIADSDDPEPTAPAVFSTITYNGKTYRRNENIVNLLFLGIDSNADRRRQSFGYRSDVVMVCAVDTDTKQATLISIPRDTYTTMYKLDDDGRVTDTLEHKINAAYAYGGKDYRAANAMACVQMFLQRENTLSEPLGFTLDIPVYFYASIDMDGISKLADAVGGVEITLDVSIPALRKSSYSLPSVGRKGETVLLKGDKAQNYLRNRDVSGGDIGRAARQRTFMLALAKKIKNMDTVDIILSLYTDLQNYSKTNLSTDQMIVFAKLLKKVDVDAITQISIPGESKRISGSSVLLHDEKQTLDILLDVYYTEVQ